MSVMMWRLRPLTFLPASVPARPAALGRFDRRAVDHPARGAGFSARPFAGLLEQDEIDPFPQPIGLPRIEGALHRRAVWKIMRQQAPRAGRSQDVKQAVDNAPQIHFARPPQPLYELRASSSANWSW